MSAFSLQKDSEKRSELEKRLHVCGEAYSDYQGFIEGALRSAKDVLVKEPFSVPELLLKSEEAKRLPRMRRVPS